ncbi:unnamed protein product [Microthlaspi erraticum]|uniref:F-box domain-containing protein n=1 Tax=Microthlaspi erraticum TaxID=1685480 RepID=A0A6D2KGH3_9BRAS|nr:unnamed protein product [Microthlaspi erraticum]
MEQQEEETQIKRRRKDSSVSKLTSSFPHDLISEILLRLPAKSVKRFGCVSRLWSSITTDAYFITSFETRPQRKSLLLCFRRGENLFAFSIPQDHSNEPFSVSSQPVATYHTTCPKNSPFYPNKSVHGLICSKKKTKAIIWNPRAKHLLTLTKPQKSWTWNHIKFFLGYDPIGRKHKVVCMRWIVACDECWVLTLGSAQESWRVVKTYHEHHLYNNRDSYECINGVLYYQAYLIHNQTVIIMSFDVRSEKFHMIKLQLENITGDGTLRTYNGRLAFHLRHGLTLWTLEDAEKHDWSPIQFPGSTIDSLDQRLGKKLNFTGITDAGELVYVPAGLGQSFYVMYYDPKRKSSHVVEHKGIADEEFRLKHGFGNRSLYKFHIVLNHTESLMSLLQIC